MTFDIYDLTIDEATRYVNRNKNMHQFTWLHFSLKALYLFIFIIVFIFILCYSLSFSTSSLFRISNSTAVFNVHFVVFSLYLNIIIIISGLNKLMSSLFYFFISPFLIIHYTGCIRIRPTNCQGRFYDQK
jgi:hypothetical protein